MTVEMFRPKDSVVYAMQITWDNLDAVAAWCGGVSAHQHVNVPIQMEPPLVYRVAYIGDWVVRLGNKFSVWTDAGMRANYDRVASSEGVRVPLTSRDVVVEGRESHMAYRPPEKKTPVDPARGSHTP